MLASNKSGEYKAIENNAVYNFNSKTEDEPFCMLWTHTLEHKPYTNDFFIECGYAIQKLSGAPQIDKDLITEHGIHRRVCKYICVQTKDEKRCRAILLNDDYWYNLPHITFENKIKNAVCQTKYKGYEVHMTDNSVSTLVPLRSCEIIDVEFE